MFNKLLIPLDGTSEAASVLPLAIALARTTLSRLTLLRVVPTLAPGSPANERDLNDAHAYLQVTATALAAQGVVVETMVREGDVAEQILEAARARDIDLIVLATHGRWGFDRLLMGSVAERLIARSPVPIILTPMGIEVPAPGVTSLLVPVDGSPGSALALAAASGLARSTGARITLLQVVVPIPVFLYGAGFPAVMVNAHIDPEWDEAGRAAAQQYVDSLAARLREEGLSATGQVGLGQPAETIVRTAEAIGADMIVMSTHGLTGLRRALLGSVADEVVRTARRPVLLMRQPAGNEAAIPARRRHEQQPDQPRTAVEADGAAGSTGPSRAQLARIGNDHVL